MVFLVFNVNLVFIKQLVLLLKYLSLLFYQIIIIRIHLLFFFSLFTDLRVFMMHVKSGLNFFEHTEFLIEYLIFLSKNLRLRRHSSLRLWSLSIFHFTAIKLLQLLFCFLYHLFFYVWSHFIELRSWPHLFHMIAIVTIFLLTLS